MTEDPDQTRPEAKPSTFGYPDPFDDHGRPVELAGQLPLESDPDSAPERRSQAPDPSDKG